MEATKEIINTNAIGAAGVHRVISELLLRGHNPAIQSYDDGVDILLENGITLQIKSGHRAHREGRLDCYNFSLSSMRYDSVYKKTHHPIRTIAADYYIFWGIDEDVFLIIPRNKLPETMNLTISLNPKLSGSGARKKHNELLDYKNKWEILNES